MPGKATVSKKKSQPLKRNPKRKTADEEMELSENEVRNTCKKQKSQLQHLSSQETGQTKHMNLKQVKISSNKRKTWQPLSQNSREHLQTLMESVIIEIVSKTIKGKEQIHYHLNCLKKRLLQQCESLNVPPKKLPKKDLTNTASVLKMERAQHRRNEESLALLQGEIDKIVETAESMTGQIQSLQDKIQILTREVEEEEKKIKELHQIVSSGDLALPELSQKSLKAPILQKEMLTLIPNQNALLEDLNVLHNSPKIKNMFTFIEEAYKRLDTF
ncbi:centromere protein Q [Sorex araneus]|uniref:centromere protein Q n=1 Tax=Sorex araneus TaxID=42254 RepID=UPI002433F9FD|nr:centromere protein Q [Sorex araneus]XP_054992129.1 centromere protein Q [Sorex araneus]